MLRENDQNLKGSPLQPVMAIWIIIELLVWNGQRSINTGVFPLLP